MSMRVSLYSSRHMDSPEAEATVGKTILPTYVGLQVVAVGRAYPRSGVAVVIRVLP